jgi:hypothetical protein
MKCKMKKHCISREKKNILHTTQRRRANWISHSWHRKRLLKHVTEGQVEGKIAGTRRQGRRSKQLLDGFKEKILEIERGGTRSLCVENTLWKRLWTCRKADCATMIT